MKRNRHSILAFVLALSLLTVSCGGVAALLAGFKGAVALATPVIDQLVVNHVITDVQATNYKQDFGDIANVTVAMHTDWVAAGTDKTKQTAAIQTGVNGYIAILNRGHLTNLPPKLQTALGYVDAIFASLSAYFSIQMPPSAQRPPRAPMASAPAKNDAELKARLDVQIDALKRTLK